MLVEKIKSEELKTMIRLKTLKYDIAEVTDEDIENLEEIELRRFKADGATLTDVDPAELEMFKGLKSLTLIGFEMTPELKSVIEGYQNLDTLQLIACEFSEVEDMIIPQELEEFIIDNPDNAYGIRFPKAKTVKVYNSKIDFDSLDLEVAENLIIQDSELDNYSAIESDTLRRIDFDGTKVYGVDGLLIDDPDVPDRAIFSHEETSPKYLDDRM